MKTTMLNALARDVTLLVAAADPRPRWLLLIGVSAVAAALIALAVVLGVPAASGLIAWFDAPSVALLSAAAAA